MLYLLRACLYTAIFLFFTWRDGVTRLADLPVGRDGISSMEIFYHVNTFARNLGRNFLLAYINEGCGVPQRSCLGPLLFNINLSWLFDVILKRHLPNVHALVRIRFTIVSVIQA